MEQIPINNSGSKGKALISGILAYIRQAAAAFTVASVNKVAITAPATSATLTIADGKTLGATASVTLGGTDGKTLSVSNSITLAGTDGRTYTFPTSNATIARSEAAQTFTGVQTFSSAIAASAGLTASGGNILIAGSGLLGYSGGGAGGQVTQATSVTTGVTLSKRSGMITTVSATTAAGSSFQFVVTNTLATTDSIIIPTAYYAGAGTPLVTAFRHAEGAFTIRVQNVHASAAFDAPLEISFVIMIGGVS